MRRPRLMGMPAYTLTRLAGLAESPGELRKLGVTSALRSIQPALRDLGDVALPMLTKDTGRRNFRNPSHFLRTTERIHDAARIIQDEDFPIILGGECSEVVGNLAGMKEQDSGRVGMLWMDAHGDFNTPETTPSGFIGGMCLAFTCGRGPPLTPRLERMRPLLRESNVVHLGGRALDPLEEKAMKESEMTLVSSRQLRSKLEEEAKKAAKRLSDVSDWVVLHLDLDVIDPLEIPAVNFPSPNGISSRDVVAVGRELGRTGKLRAIEVTSYNPLNDPGSVSGKRVVELISRLAT